jgi:hypothetical protein
VKVTGVNVTVGVPGPTVPGMLVITVPVVSVVGAVVSVGGTGVFVWVAVGVAVLDGAAVEVGRISNVWVGRLAPPNAATVAPTLTDCVGLADCSRNAGMHALKVRDRLKTTRSNFFIAQLRLWDGSILGGDFHELGHDIAQHPFG